MPLAVGIDVAKELHWAAIVRTDNGELVTSRSVSNTPEAIQALISEIQAAATEHGQATVALDVLGGIAGLAEAMLLDAGIRLVHVPGLAVNRARRATVGGERKSDPKDARVIADQVRIRDDLRPVTEPSAVDAELRLLVGRRRELVTDQTRRLGRLRDLLTSVHPGLEAGLDVTTKTAMWLLARYVTPAEIRAAGRTRLTRYLGRIRSVKTDRVAVIVDHALTAAKAQQVAVPGEAVAADIIRDLASEALASKDRVKSIDKRIAETLKRHPDAALVASLPGMGATLTAEFLAEAGGIARFPTADQLASAAGLAPVLKQSGKVRYLQRATAGNKTLKRVFYQSAFIAAGCEPTSKTYYRRKRGEGKTHHQAVLALARRRVNVLHAILRTRTPYRVQPEKTATAA
ncbi:MAG: IS110 family transposase [Nocardioidaceae bacterium]